MATFPTLSSGAITQYPLVFGVSQGTSVIRFMDGTDQRFLTQGKQLRSWQIRLELLSDTEMEQLETFFDAQQGAYSTFTFPDPISGAGVPNCVLGSAELTTVYGAPDAGSASLWVVETNG
jgi:hypothetical protein